MIAKQLKFAAMAAVTLSALHLGAAEFFINGYLPQNFKTVEEKDATVFFCEYDFMKNSGYPKELQLTGAFKRHKVSNLNGYNGDLTLKLEVPGSEITEIEAILPMDGQDSKVRTVEYSCSTDGKNYTDAARMESVAGKENICKVKVPANDGKVYLRYRRKYEAADTNGNYGFIVAKGLKLKTTARPKATAEPEFYPDLKEFFPTGVFWGWERTRGNAELAGMEMWAWVEKTISDFKKQGCNTFWFVNIYPGNDMKKLLEIGEKYDVKMLLNTSAVPLFNQGLKSVEWSEELAGRTIDTIGSYKSLLAYVLKDEPLLCSLSQIDYLYDTMKRMDPFGRDSVAVTMNRPSQTYASESKLPVSCMDIYYFGHKKTDLIPATLSIPQPEAKSQELFRASVDALNDTAFRHGKNFWLMPQAFHDIWGRNWFDLKKKVFIVYPDCFLNWRMPTVAEMHWQTWEAIRLGSKGVIYYISHPPVPLTVPPEDINPNDKTAKWKVAAMDKASAQVKSWKSQAMTTQKFELPDPDALTWPGGEPTKQMLAMGEDFRTLRRYADIILKRRPAGFPVYFVNGGNASVTTYELPDRPGRRLGVLVNNNLFSDENVELLVPANTVKITDLASGKVLELGEAKNPAFKQTVLPMKAGAGTLLLSEFANQNPGILFFHENFRQHDQFRVRRDWKNTDIGRYGAYGAFSRYAILLKKEAKPFNRAFVIDNLTNRKSAGNTILMNLNNTQQDGTVFVQLSGPIQGAEIRAINNAEKEGEKTNVNYIRDDFFGPVKYTGDGKVTTILKERERWYVPVVVPPGTTSLEVWLGSGTMVSDVRLWFVPGAETAAK